MSASRQALPAWIGMGGVTLALLAIALCCQLLLSAVSSSAQALSARDLLRLCCAAASILLLLNACIGLWRQLGELSRDLRPEPLVARSAPGWELKVRVPDHAREAAQLVELLGYRVLPRSDGSVWGQRWRWAGLGAFLLLVGPTLVAFGALTAAAALAPLPAGASPGAPLTVVGLVVVSAGLLLGGRRRRAEVLLSPADERGRAVLRGFGGASPPSLGGD